MTDHIHLLIAADEEDAMNYVGDPTYTDVKYVRDIYRLRGTMMHEASFTPRATNYPHWMEALMVVIHNVTRTTGDRLNKIHYIPLFPEEAA